MRKLFYPRLALNSIRLNRRFCVPYLLTLTVCCVMFYNMVFMQMSRGLEQVGGDLTTSLMRQILLLGAIVVAVFSCIFLFYSHSLMMKQRRRELGLYSVLGMQKSNIARVMLWEGVAVNGAGILLGLVMGVALSKLVLLLLCAMLRFPVPFGFEISWPAMAMTALLFAAIGVLNLLYSLLRVSVLNPISLLRSASQGEREPKANWPLAVLGALSLGAGYTMALLIRDPVQAISFFFIAVLLVILGTYCLFIAGSIAVLRALRRNKRFYYKINHFTAVSGMMYRMRQNAAGLASICILSTMVLVMLSTTVCLNVGVDGSLKEQYPTDFRLESGQGMGELSLSAEQVAARRDQTLSQAGFSAANEKTYCYNMIYALFDGGELRPADQDGSFSRADYARVLLLSMADCAPYLPGQPTLAADEALCQALVGESAGDTLLVGGETFRCRQADLYHGLNLPSWLLDTNQRVVAVVLPDDSSMRRTGEALLQQGQSYDDNLVSVTLFDVPDASRAQQIQLRWDMLENMRVRYTDDEGQGRSAVLVHLVSRAEQANEFYSIYGGLLFIGLFLGLLFLMATAMIIYYKQISEGYEDQKRYEIMQKVGMTRQEVRRAISSQILMVFFLPLLAAVTHLLFAFPMISRMLSLFELTDIGLFALTTGATALLFAAAYAFIYWLTAKMYYHIVEA